MKSRKPILTSTQKLSALRFWLLDLDSIGGLHSNALSGFLPSSNKQVNVNVKASIGTGINTAEVALIHDLDAIRESRVARAAYMNLTPEDQTIIGLVINHDLVKFPVMFIKKSLVSVQHESFCLAAVICYLSSKKSFKRSLVGMHSKSQIDINFSKEEFRDLLSQAKIRFNEAISNYLIQCDLVVL